MVHARGIIEELKKQGVTHVVGIPDNGSRGLYEALWEDPQIEVVLVSREGEAYALASGLYLGGKQPLVLIQNTGFLEAGDGFRGTAYNMQVPLVMLMGYRGYKTMQPDAPRLDTVASFFEPTLKAWDIPYTILHTGDDLPQIAAAFQQASETSKPAAVLFTEEIS